MNDLKDEAQKKREILTCPLCGNRFTLEEAKCLTECSTKCGCDLIGCPNCHYKFPEKSKIAGFVQKLFKREGKKND